MPDSIRIAVLGNSFAARVQLPALRWAGYNRVCALAGEDAEKARATAQELHSWGSVLQVVPAQDLEPANYYVFGAEDPRADHLWVSCPETRLEVQQQQPVATS